MIGVMRAFFDGQAPMTKEGGVIKKISICIEKVLAYLDKVEECLK